MASCVFCSIVAGEVPANVVRLSVGIEDVADLTADLLAALDRVARA
jgi:cystathionine beta-lyase/cystathionine gamma-synthase